jgi:creatinine amidohydrolase
MPSRPWVLSEIHYSTTKSTTYEVAVLPFGATEPHNLHLPYGTDTYEADAIGSRICEAAYDQGARVVLLPTIPYGTETNMRSLPLAMNLYPSTLHYVIRDLVESLVRSGIRKVLLLNSHGGNEFKPVLRELAGQTPAHLFVCNWFRIIQDRYHDIFTHAEDHAGEMETSLMLANHPGLVRTDDDGRLMSDEGATCLSRFKAVNEGWVGLTRDWDLLTSNTGSGNPLEASAEKGNQLMDLLVERLSEFLVELSQSKLDERFPFEQPDSP